jgi:DUF971 family protein
MPIPLPLEITKTGARQLTVRWDDGHTSVYPIRLLRAECTCAVCVNELTGARTLDPATIGEEITILDAQHVGRYGVRFKFSDQHDQGIYTWERLRAICPCDLCHTQPAGG